MAGSKPDAEAKRLAALCEQAIGELRSERRAARGAVEKQRIGAQIAALKDMLGWARARLRRKKAGAG